MWVEQLPNGKYRVGERYTDPLTGKKKKVSVTIDTNTKKTVKAAEKILEDRITAKILPSKKTCTLKQLGSAYVQDQYTTVRESTARRNEFFAKSACQMFGEDALVDQLNAGYVRSKLIESGKTPNSMNEFLTRFKSMIRWGYQNDYIEDISYLSKLQLFKDDTKKIKTSERYLEQEELEALIDDLPESWKDLTKFQALSGLRIGESMALTIKDIDLKEREIHVNKTWDIVNNSLHDTSKTPAGVRDVFIQDELLPLCKELLRVARTERMATGCELVFQKNGKHIVHGSYAKALRNSSQKILGRKIAPHVLRHTHVSLLAPYLSLDEISRRVGHEDSKITRRVYFHVTQKLKEQDNERIKSVKIL